MRCRQAGIVATDSSLVSMTLAIKYIAVTAVIYGRCYCHMRLIVDGVVDTGQKLIASVMESMKIRNKAQSPVPMPPAINL
jgi:hypothetical protein